MNTVITETVGQGCYSSIFTELEVDNICFSINTKLIILKKVKITSLFGEQIVHFLFLKTLYMSEML